MFIKKQTVELGFKKINKRDSSIDSRCQRPVFEKKEKLKQSIELADEKKQWKFKKIKKLKKNNWCCTKYISRFFWYSPRWDWIEYSQFYKIKLKNDFSKDYQKLSYFLETQQGLKENKEVIQKLFRCCPKSSGCS